MLSVMRVEECETEGTNRPRGFLMRDWPASAKLVVALLVLFIVVPMIFRLVWLAIVGAAIVGVGYLAYQALGRKR
jgi:hypothetical protein